MSSDEHRFLFASLGSKQPRTTRQVHIRRLYDLLQLCFQRHDYERAKRAWSILARCKEVKWKALWPTALVVMSGNAAGSETGQVPEFLRTMMLQYPDERQVILKELVFRLLLANKCREALDELELYLPSFPYQDDPVLHTYAGLCSIYLACDQPQSSSSQSEPANLSAPGVTKSFNHGQLREAQVHLEHAKILDPDNSVAEAFLDKIRDLQSEQKLSLNDTDDDDMVLEDTRPYRKRSRT